MKQFIKPNLKFTIGAANSGTVQFINFPGGFDIRFLVAILNVTRGGALLYSAGTALSAYNAATATVTLAVDTSAYDPTDILQVLYDFPNDTVSSLDTTGAPIYRPVTVPQDATVGLDTIDATNRYALTTVAVLAGGTGHAIGDELTLTGGTFSIAARVKVTSINAGTGAVTGVALVPSNVRPIGKYTASIATSATSSNGSGTGCTLTTTMEQNVVCLVDTTGYNFMNWAQLNSGTSVVAYPLGSFDGGKTWRGFIWVMHGNSIQQITAGSFTNGGPGGGPHDIPQPMPLIKILNGSGSAETVSWSLNNCSFAMPLVGQGSAGNANNAWFVKPVVNNFASGNGNPNAGCIRQKIISAASTNATLLTSFGVRILAGYDLYNAGATVAFLKFYDKGSAAPTVGTDTPSSIIAIPPGGKASGSSDAIGQCISNSPGGLGYAIVGGTGLDADTTPVAAAQITGTLWIN